jgi:hypothetical protein
MFFVSGIALLILASLELWQGILPGADFTLYERFDSMLESIGLLAVALVALELAQTILEEEIQREANVSAPTRVRRFVSRFLVVIVIALAVECLVVVFRLGHEDPSQLPHAAAVGVSAAAILLAWGVFIRLNRAAEELEPEAMQRAKREDQKVE